jgi:hypothetical protein
MSTSTAAKEMGSLHRGEKANVGIKLAQMRTTREKNGLEISLTNHGRPGKRAKYFLESNDDRKS